MNVLLKIVHLVKSDFNFVYKNEKLSTIWLDKNKYVAPSTDDKNKGLGSSTEYRFIMKNNTFIVELKEKKDIKGSDLYNAQLSFVGITSYKNRWYVIFPSNAQKPPLKKAKTQNLLLNPLKNDFNYMPIFDNEINGFLNDNSINSLINQLKNDLRCIKKSQNEINKFLTANPKNLMDRILIKDSTSIQKSTIEEKKNLNDKYSFIQSIKTKRSNTGWVNIFKGINLYSNEYDDNHHHVHFYGENNTTNLFNLIGQKFKCSCYYLYHNKKMKECKKVFTFQKKVQFYDCTYYIDGVPHFCPDLYVDEYDLQKENNSYFSIK